MTSFIVKQSSGAAAALPAVSASQFDCSRRHKCGRVPWTSRSDLARTMQRYNCQIIDGPSQFNDFAPSTMSGQEVLLRCAIVSLLNSALCRYCAAAVFVSLP